MPMVVLLVAHRVSAPCECVTGGAVGRHGGRLACPTSGPAAPPRPCLLCRFAPGGSRAEGCERDKRLQNRKASLTRAVPSYAAGPRTARSGGLGVFSGGRGPRHPPTTDACGHVCVTDAPARTTLPPPRQRTGAPTLFGDPCHSLAPRGRAQEAQPGLPSILIAATARPASEGFPMLLLLLGCCWPG